MTIAELAGSWFRKNGRDLPWRAENFSAWGILVSEVMLQQTPVVRVVPRLEEWLTRWPTPADLAAAPAGDAVRAWKSLGYPRRALSLHAAAQQIVDRHQGEVPRDIGDLLKLSGVGDYTARAVAAFAFGIRHPVVDINVRRVLARAVAGHGEPAPPSVRRDLEQMEQQLPLDPVAARLANAAIMELGAIVCTARGPRCTECPLSEVCAWRLAGKPDYAGIRTTRQKPFLGSDRQVRGILLARLRGSDTPLAASDLKQCWPDDTQRERALSSLMRDGLVVDCGDAFALPG